MKTLVVNNQKGGVGKTMLACHVAWFLAETPGARVAVLDFDTQGNASTVLSKAHSGGLAAQLFVAPTMGLDAKPPREGITLFAASNHLVDVQENHARHAATLFAELEGHFDYVVIDTPPSWGWRNYAALRVTDYLISPVEVEMFAVSGLTQLRENIRAIDRERSRPVDFLGLLVSRFQSNSPHQRAGLKELIQAASTLMFPGVITNRQGYSQAMVQKAPVWTLPGTAQQIAGKELRAVLERLKSRLDGATQEVAA